VRSCEWEGDYDCSDARIELALTEPVCGGMECSMAMVAAFWLPNGNRSAFKRNCAVIQWVRGYYKRDGKKMFCDGPDCTSMPVSCPEGTCYVDMCFPGSNCWILSSENWHVDQNRAFGPMLPLFDNATYEGVDWDTVGLPIPPNVPTDRAVWTHDTPTLKSTESGQVLEANVEFVVAVYNRKDLDMLPKHGGDDGNPYGPPMPVVTQEWSFKMEGPYITQ
jgi:hypothetical protein